MEQMTILLKALSLARAARDPTADMAVKDGYAGLKTLLWGKFGPKSPALAPTLEDHAADPETFDRPAAKVLGDVGADRDQEVMARAIALLEAAEQARAGATGPLVERVDAPGGIVTVIGGNVDTINYPDASYDVSDARARTSVWRASPTGHIPGTVGASGRWQRPSIG